MQVNILNFNDGSQIVDAVSLPESIYGIQAVRNDILHRCIVWQLAGMRRGTHKALNRSEVSYSGKKIYRQKGTGGARHGDRGSVIFRHGGVVKGPIPRSHGHSLPKKVRKLAMRHMLSAKMAKGEVFILDELSSSAISCAALRRNIDSFMGSQLSGEWNSKKMRVLFVDGDNFDENFSLSSRNLPLVDVIPAVGLNVLSIMRASVIFLTLAAIGKLNERLK